MKEPTEKKRVGVTRKKADELIRGLIQRADQINASPEFIWKIIRIEIFGSYLTPKEKLGDIDVAVELEIKDRANFRDQLIKQMHEAPGQFQGWAAAYWPQEKVMRALKARHTAFSIHDAEELDQMKKRGEASGRLIYPPPQASEDAHAEKEQPEQQHA